MNQPTTRMAQCNIRQQHRAPQPQRLRECLRKMSDEELLQFAKKVR